MGDPYVPPVASNAGPGPRPLPGWALVLALAPALLTALLATVAVPAFIETYRNFGADLPMPTHLLVKWYGAAWLWPLVVIGVFVQARTHRFGAVIVSMVAVVGSGLVAAGVVWALYLPMFKLAATI